jgi:hypothetical protein
VRDMATGGYLVLRRCIDVTRQTRNRTIIRQHAFHLACATTRYSVGDISLLGLPLVARNPTSLHFYRPSLHLHIHTCTQYRMGAYSYILWDGFRRDDRDKESVEAHRTKNRYLTGCGNNPGKQPRPIQQVERSICSSMPTAPTSPAILIHDIAFFNTTNIYTNITRTVASCRNFLSLGISTGHHDDKMPPGCSFNPHSSTGRNAGLPS